MSQYRILFVRNGTFSFTNHSVLKQLIKHFPDCDIIDHDVMLDTYRNRLFFLINTIKSISTYGFKEIIFSRRRGFYFFRTSYFFDNACSQLFKKLRRSGTPVDLVIQTQGIFNGRYIDAPLLIYTDYTYKSVSFGGAAVPAELVERETSLFRSADGIAVSAEHVRNTLVHDYDCEPRRVTTVYIGSNSTKTATVDGIGRFASKQVCFVGIDWDRKGGEDLVRAFDLVLQRVPEAKLVIAGASPRLTQKQITVLGRISQADVAELYRHSAVFCLPSLVEPSSVAAIEAATYGLPIVATKLGGFLDSVVDGVTGVLVPPRDPEALAEAIWTLIDSPARAEQMGAAGKRHAQERFDWERVGDKIAALACEISRVRP